MQDLKQLIHAAQKGDLAAFNTVVKRFQDIAFGVAYARLGNVQLAEDNDTLTPGRLAALP